MSLLKEFRPALMFLGKFVAFYLVANILYGLYVESYGTKADPITWSVTSQTSSVLSRVGFDTSLEDSANAPKVLLQQNHLTVLNVFEGCNGINVMIVFVAFLFAFGGSGKRLAWFLPLGLVVIHLFNLLRIALLFFLALHNSRTFYYFHKYFFTATLYLVVFMLWVIWVSQFNPRKVGFAKD
jgi:exosortase family protein XrtF